MPPPPPVPTVNDALLKRMERFDSFMKQQQGTDKFRAIDYQDLCLFPEVQLLPKFKIPEFPKYNGTGDPVAHLKIFCNLLGNPTSDPRIAMRVFARSLEGDALSWYLMLDPKKLQDWTDLANAFVKQYEFNRDLEPDRFALMNLKKKPSEDYREYVKDEGR
ncbi:hypothetical protein ACH5RR_021956 [Cinchona calisaya]|uniref:Retrotransposon gag domain-containing protein n=1 Tax=Cinchona calisaya TaxID=153742 RepID=A0ABD2Z6E9_9GENT